MLDWKQLYWGGDTIAPRINDNVLVCWGAAIIGDVEIASNVIIGANSTICKSIIEGGTYVGINKKIR